MNNSKVLLLIVSLCCALIVNSASGASDPAANVKMEHLLQQAFDSTFISDREVVVSVVEIPPNTSVERHCHPGEEFHYYLEGEVTIEIDGHEAIKGTPGTTGHVPYESVHKATAGAKGAKLIVFRVHRKGEPVLYPEAECKAEK